MLYIAAVALSVISLSVLALRPYHGILLLIMSKPIIDTAFYNVFAFGLSVTRITAVIVPFLIFLAILRASPSASVGRIPLKGLWLVYVSYIFFFSSMTILNSGIIDGLQMFFRHSHGFVGYYMVQAFFLEQEKLRTLLRAFLIAGLFPVATGIYQAITGQILSPLAGGDVVEGLQRSVGFYHDVFTVRYYALQTLITILLYWVLFVPKEKIKVISLIGYALFSVVVVFKAYTKSGLTTLTLWGIIWTVFQRKYAQLAVIIGSAFLVAIYFADTIIATIQTIFRKEIGAIQGEIKVENTFEGRWTGWHTLFDEWTDLGFMSQMFGSGELMTYAHNDYLQMLFHGGVIGLTIYITLLLVTGLMILRNLFEKVEPLRVAAAMLFLMYLIDTVGLVPSSYVGYQWLVWGFIGLSFRRRAEERSGAGAGNQESTEMNRAKQDNNFSKLHTHRRLLNRAGDKSAGT